MRQQHPFSEVSPSCLSSVSSCPSCPIFLLLQPFSSVSPSPRRYSSISGSLSGLSGAACWIITVFGGPDLITELLPLRNSSPRKGLSPASQPACFSFHSTPPKFAYRLHLAAERACLALCLIIATSSKEGGGRGDCISRESENSRGDEILARPTGLQLNTVGNIRIVAIIKRQTNLGVSEGPP